MKTIVLVHGIAASDRLPPELLWGRIPETLRRAGYNVFFGGTDAVGTYQTNAAQLNATIARVCRETGSAKVALMAHSKGGIDARYCLSSYDRGQRVAALLTVCSPHQGSELADAIIEKFPQTSEAVHSLSRTIAKLFPDREPAPLEAVLGLTTRDMAVFNREVTDVPGVRYQSCYTVLHGAFDDLALSPSYRLLNARVGANDGVVSAVSAQWGQRPRQIEGIRGGISHWEILDLKRRKISGLSIPDVWVELAEQASETL
jgi:pimeloyl-ACP methyl ester carboxylesterase